MTTTRTGTRPGSRRSIVVGSRRDSCNVWTEHPSVSAMHARITQLVDGRFTIEDLGSIEGTWLVNPFTSGRIPVPSGLSLIMAPGTRVVLGSVELPWTVDR